MSRRDAVQRCLRKGRSVVRNPGVVAHDGVLAAFADKAGFLAVVCAAVDVVFDEVGECEALAEEGEVEDAVEVDPLAAV